MMCMLWQTTLVSLSDLLLLIQDSVLVQKLLYNQFLNHMTLNQSYFRSGINFSFSFYIILS